jgi:hypothetical protein
MRYVLCRFLPLLCACAAVLGCSSEVEPPAVSTTAVEVPAQPASTATDVPGTATHTPDVADAADTKATPVAFTPPFPDRLELFEPPKRAQSTVRRDDEHGETVELKGFINVDRPRVILSIDGVISPVAEGGEKYGVTVIAIQPPSVVLQRGRNRWTATLE